jgi:hypothetical protein
MRLVRTGTFLTGFATMINMERMGLSIALGGTGNRRAHNRVAMRSSAGLRSGQWLVVLVVSGQWPVASENLRGLPG